MSETLPAHLQDHHFEGFNAPALLAIVRNDAVSLLAKKQAVRHLLKNGFVEAGLAELEALVHQVREEDGDLPAPAVSQANAGALSAPSASVTTETLHSEPVAALEAAQSLADQASKVTAESAVQVVEDAKVEFHVDHVPATLPAHSGSTLVVVPVADLEHAAAEHLPEAAQ